MAISSELVAVILGLASAVIFGVSDFSGGIASRLAHVYRVLVVAYLVGFALLIVLALVSAEKLPSGADVFWAFGAGISGTIGVMGIAAPVTGVLAAGIPALFGAFFQEIPGPVAVVGFVLAIMGIFLVSRPHDALDHREGLGLALIGGCGFGGFLIMINRINADSIFWSLGAARFIALAILFVLMIASRQRLLPERNWLPFVLVTGVLDVIGNVMFVLAGQLGTLAIAAVLSSLYPAITVLMARMILKEHVSRTQGAGIIAMLVAIPLIAWR
jgi:drug/metabolite transporter (DMT)-like permease